MAPWIEEAQEMRAGQKQFEKEVSAVLQLTQILLEKARTKCGSGGASAVVNWSKVLENLRKCEHKLKVLKRHRMQSANRMKTLVQRSFSRLRFMRKMTPPQVNYLEEDWFWIIFDGASGLANLKLIMWMDFIGA